MPCNAVLVEPIPQAKSCAAPCPKPQALMKPSPLRMPPTHTICARPRRCFLCAPAKQIADQCVRYAARVSAPAGWGAKHYLHYGPASNGCRPVFPSARHELAARERTAGSDSVPVPPPCTCRHRSDRVGQEHGNINVPRYLIVCLESRSTG